MNDRFKFRFWDKEDCSYFEPQTFDGVWLDKDGGLHIGCYSDFTQDIEDYGKEVIIEQCTGLKDKNGNLIYEGDIVKYSCSGKGIVRFGNYTGCFACGWENIYVDLFGWYLDDYYEPDECGRLRINFDNSHSPITEEDDGDFEIIGNIHEQAEQKDKQ